MTMMGAETPNSMRVEHGELTFSACFGKFFDAQTINVTGSQGHVPHMRIRFCYGLRLDLTREDTIALIRDLTVRVVGMPAPRGAVEGGAG